MANAATVPTNKPQQLPP